MTNSEQSQLRYARLAGLMYILIIAIYILSIQITSRIELPGNPIETAHRIVDSELLYRAGLSLGVLNTFFAVLLAFGLYFTLKPVNNNLALLAFIFELIYVTIGAALNVFDFVFMKLQMGAYSTPALDPKQLASLANLHTFVSSVELNITCIIYGAGSILFFYLFLKSNYIPKFLSAFGLFSSILVPIMGFVFLILPQPAKTLQLGWVPIFITEIVGGLWLLIKGVNLTREN
jgi:hypothetical protein